MNSHLAVRIDGHFAALPEDAAIDIEDSNPYFNDTPETWSYSFDLPLDGNEDLLGNIADIASDRRLVSMENKSMEVYADGIEFRNGKVATTEDQEIKDKVSISMTSINKQLTDLFGDLTLQDITFPVEDKEDLQIGEMLGDVIASGSIEYGYQIDAWLYFNPDYGRDVYSFIKRDIEQHIPIQALGFSTNKAYHYTGYEWVGYRKGEKVEKDANGNLVVDRNFINVDAPYGTTIVQPDGSTRRALYFNARVCYNHYRKNPDGTASDSKVFDRTGYGPYFVLDADRPQSGICFYILYVIRSVFKYFGLIYDNDQESVLMRVPDLCRLGFFTTKCKFDIERKFKGYERNGLTEWDFVPGDDFDKNGINKWLSENKIKGSLKPRNEKKKGELLTGLFGDHLVPVSKGDRFSLYYIDDIYAIDGRPSGTDLKYSGNIHKMYANSKNLPEMSLSSFFDSLWSSFGIKFGYDAKSNIVTPFLIRDILRDNREPIVIPGDAWTVHKNSEKISGFKMRYSGESDKDEQEGFLRKSVTDYDTSYDYIVERSPEIKYIKYEDVIAQRDATITVGTYTCYVDLRTGNAYRVKINKEALDGGEVLNLAPVLFQVAQWHGVEIGDCSEGNSDFIIELVSEFQPIDQNNINGELHASVPLLCTFVDDDMWNEETDMEAKGAGVISYVFDNNPNRTFLIDAIIDTEEKYDPGSTDDKNSPLQSHDWGNAICMMRGGGADAHIDYYDYDYDGFGSAKIRTISGKYAMDSDSISLAAEEYDYNGDGDNGIGEGERFSLKIRAFHTNPKTGEIMCNNDRIARRGLYDRFMSDYAHFVLNRKKVTVTGIVNAIDIKNIQWDRRYNIGGVIGWINKISTHISLEKGIEKCTFEMYVL